MAKTVGRRKSELGADIPFIKVPRVIGLIIILIGFAQLVYSASFLIRAERAEATITQSVFLPSIRSSTRYGNGVNSGAELTLIFTDKNGASHTAQIVRRGFGRYTRDEKVPILFLPETPEYVIENTWVKTWGRGLIFILAGIVFWKLSVHIMISQHKMEYK